MKTGTIVIIVILILVIVGLAIFMLTKKEEPVAPQRESTLGQLMPWVTLIASDRKLKENIHLVAKSNSGIPVYHFNYKGDKTKYQGVMAQDLEENNSEAIHIGQDGTLFVDYKKIDVEFKKILN